MWPRVWVLADQQSAKHTFLRHPPEQLRPRFRITTALLPMTSTAIPGPTYRFMKPGKGTSARPSCCSSLLPLPSPGPRQLLTGGLARPSSSWSLASGSQLGTSRDTAPTVLRRPSRPLVPLLRLGHLAPRPCLAPRVSRLPSPVLRTTHQKHRSVRQTRLSKLTFLSHETVQGCCRKDGPQSRG